MSDTAEIVASALALFRRSPAFALIADVMDHRSDLRVFLAGGTLRDCVLQRERPPHDFDLFLAGPSVGRLLEHAATTGSLRSTPFGSPRWFPPDCEGQYCDLIAIEQFTNGLGPCHDMVDALKQFDFTGNALAIDLRTREFLDPVDGLRDLRNRVMRMIVAYPDEPIASGVPLTRLTVLWFRILHYAASLRLAIAPATLKWLVQHRDRESLADTYATWFSPPHPDYLLPIHDNRPD